jgi:hypothetical protein
MTGRMSSCVSFVGDAGAESMPDGLETVVLIISLLTAFAIDNDSSISESSSITIFYSL